MNCNKVLYNGATLHLVPAGRKPVVLCFGELCKIERYIGLHCLPSRLRNAVAQRWLYCFLIHERNNTGNVYLKIILEKQQDVLVILAQYSVQNLTQAFLDACFCEHSSDFVNIRATLMLTANTFTYDSIKRFVDDIQEYKTSYRIEWLASNAAFISLYN
jgi:hypothetical protein